MNKTCELLLLTAIVPIFAARCTPQFRVDSLEDVFPFVIGNQWTFDYKSSIWDQLPYVWITDTGTAAYTITNAIVEQDSTRWIFTEDRNVKHRYSQPSIRDTTYFLTDEHEFEIIEINKGRHRLYGHTTGYDFMASVFPFFSSASDSSTIYRFSQVDSAMQSSIAFRIRYDSFDTLSVYLLFKKGIGATKTRVDGGPVSVVYHTNHSLASYVLTSSPDRSFDESPQRYTLFQNYPNPCNGSTKISFQVPQMTFVTLRMFDVLGRPLRILYEGMAQPGVHNIYLLADDLQSGVYFYQLTSPTYRNTKKLMLVK